MFVYLSLKREEGRNSDIKINFILCVKLDSLFFFLFFRVFHFSHHVCVYSHPARLAPTTHHKLTISLFSLFSIFQVYSSD